MPGHTRPHRSSPIEHHSVLDTVEHLAQDEVVVRWLSVDRFGLIDPGEVEELIGNDTVLVSIGYGNNEWSRSNPSRRWSANQKMEARGRLPTFSH